MNHEAHDEIEDHDVLLIKMIFVAFDRFVAFVV